MKLLVVTATHHPSFELSDSELAIKLTDRNYNVTYAAKSNEMYNFKNKKIKDNYCGFPGLKKNDFNKINLNKKILFNKWSELKKLIKQNDVIILGGYRDSSWIIEYSRLLNKKVFYHKNPAELLIDCKLSPNVFFLKDIFQKKQVKTSFKYKSLKKFNNKDKFIVTGSLQYNSIFKKKKFNYKNFCKKYSLNTKKKLVLFLPLAPQHHTENYKKDYKEICEKIQKNFNLLVKGHPSDIFKRKSSVHYKKNQHSWEALGIKKICKPEDFYEAINHSICCVAIYSTVFVEVNLNNKPILFVNKYDHLYEMLTKKFQRFPNKIYKSKLGWNVYKIPKTIVSEHIKKIKKSGKLNHFLKDYSYLFDNSYKFYGKEIAMKSLKKELKIISKVKSFNISRKKIGVENPPLDNIINNIEIELKKNRDTNLSIINYLKYMYKEIKHNLLHLFQIIKVSL